MACPDDEAIQGFLERTLSRQEREAVAAHVDGCAACRSLIADASLITEEGAGALEDAGRYVLLSTLGAGGMGMVQAAFDKQLGRKVALKFLVAEPGLEPRRAAARLQREAQALARLSHPNVVTVHDVGMLDGEVFVAMELVEGTTLRAWATTRPRSTREVVAAIRQAGEGLAAAHAVGLVHTDFKPDNVLVGDDGRVRVTDFGLAHAFSEDDSRAPRDGVSDGASTVTRTGVRGGTPAYMAPEQLLGQAPSARSDIYSFCVTLAEVVTGARPGQPEVRRAPAWLKRIVARGLHQDVDDRWPDMRALLDAMGRGPAVTPVRVALGLGLALFTFALLFPAWRERPASPCAPDTAAFSGIWDGARREAVHAVFRAAYPARADVAFDAVDGALGRLRERWISMRADSCAATRIRHDQSEQLLDLRTACLDSLRLQVAATADVLTHADRGVVENAVSVAADLPRIEACADARALAAVEPVPTDPERRAVVTEAEAKFARAEALVRVGKEPEVLALVEPALAAARRASYAPIEAKLMLLRGNALMELSPDRATLETSLHAAAQKALEARDDGTAAMAWTLLMWQVRGRGQQGWQWSDYIEAAIRRHGGDDFLEADRLGTLGVLELEVGHLDRARELLDKARPLFERSRGPECSRIAGVDDALGSVALAEERLEEAVRLHRQARALRERVFGLEHGATVSSLFSEQADLVRQGHVDEALAMLADIGKIIERNGGEGFLPQIDESRAYLDAALADALRAKGDAAAALEHDRQALAGYELDLAPDDRGLSRPLAGEGRDLLALGRAADAIAPLERATALSVDVESPERARILFDLARALVAVHRDATRATALGRQAEALFAPAAARYGGRYKGELAAVRAWLSARE